jgi:streptomycin 6-kinase
MFQEIIIALAGEAGKKWLDELPNLVHFYEQQWQLTCSEPFPLSYNYVLPGVTLEGNSVVLKISFPNNREFENELAALRIYDGDGSIKIIKEDRANKVVLLERAVPGKRIGDLEPDTTQISVVCEVVRKIHKPWTAPNDQSFPTLVDWGKAFARYRKKYEIASGPIPTRMFEEAEDLFTQYANNNSPQYLLHGDLHNDNILLSERGWLAIDPKGVIGNQEFEIGTYLRNPLTDLPQNSHHKQVVANRIQQFSDELGLDPKNVLRWTFANAIVSLLWCLEDENKLNEMYIRNAVLISEITV